MYGDFRSRGGAMWIVRSEERGVGRKVFVSIRDSVVTILGTSPPRPAGTAYEMPKIVKRALAQLRVRHSPEAPTEKKMYQKITKKYIEMGKREDMSRETTRRSLGSGAVGPVGVRSGRRREVAAAEAQHALSPPHYARPVSLAQRKRYKLNVNVQFSVSLGARTGMRAGSAGSQDRRCASVGIFVGIKAASRRQCDIISDS
jgi:hypothetical protein